MRHHRAEGVDVGARLGVSCEHFRRGVSSRTDERIGVGCVRARDTEVDEVNVSLGREHHVVGFEVAEDDRRLLHMEVLDDVAELRHPFDHGSRREELVAFRQHLGEVTALDVFEREVGLVAVAHEEIEEPWNARVVQRGEQLGLAAEHVELLLHVDVRQLGSGDELFESAVDMRVLKHLIAHEVDVAHTAGADDALDAPAIVGEGVRRQVETSLLRDARGLGELQRRRVALAGPIELLALGDRRLWHTREHGSPLLCCTARGCGTPIHWYVLLRARASWFPGMRFVQFPALRLNA